MSRLIACIKVGSPSFNVKQHVKVFKQRAQSTVKQVNQVKNTSGAETLFGACGLEQSSENGRSVVDGQSRETDGRGWGEF